MRGLRGACELLQLLRPLPFAVKMLRKRSRVQFDELRANPRRLWFRQEKESLGQGNFPRLARALMGAPFNVYVLFRNSPSERNFRRAAQ